MCAETVLGGGFWTDIEGSTTTLCIHFPGVVLGKQVPKDRHMCSDHWRPALLHLILTTALSVVDGRDLHVPPTLQGKKQTGSYTLAHVMY